MTPREELTEMMWRVYIDTLMVNSDEKSAMSNALDTAVDAALEECRKPVLEAMSAWRGAIVASFLPRPPTVDEIIARLEKLKEGR